MTMVMTMAMEDKDDEDDNQSNKTPAFCAFFKSLYDSTLTIRFHPLLYSF